MTVLKITQAAAGIAALLTITSCAAGGAISQQSPPGSVTGTASAAAPSTVIVTQTVVSITTVTAAPSGSSVSAASAASVTPTPANASASATESSTLAPHVTPTALAGGLATGQADTVVLDFLGALERDSSGKAAMPYLSSRLQAQLQGGRPVSSLLNVQGKFSQYHADAAVSRGGGRAATVRITLTLPTGSVQRLVTLIPESGAWRIDDIANSSA